MKAFLLVVLAGFVGAALGVGFGWLVGTLSPEFLALLAHPHAVIDPQRLGAALGLVTGLLLGAAVMAFGLLVEAFRLWILRGQANNKSQASLPSHYRPNTDNASSNLHVRPV